MKKFLAIWLPLLATTVASQDQPSPAATFQAACARMAALKSVAFDSVETQDDAMLRMIRGQVPEGIANPEKEVSGGAAGDLRWASLNIEEDEMVMRHGRAVARYEGDGWHPRAGVLFNGTPAPFVLDPELLFRMLGKLPDAVRATASASSTELRGAPVTLLALTLEADLARDLVLGGGLPMAGRSGGGMVLMGLGGAAPRPEAPDVTVDLAIWVEPASGNVLRLRAAAYQKNAAAGQVHIQFQGGGDVDVQAADEVEEFDSAGERRIVGGLPVRKPADGESAMTIDVRFSKHDTASAPELDEVARAHLGLTKS